tara:strand:+ start:114 stop:398 length:285 start_codon:yes stop_codon:yes gene_type:complete
MKQRQERKSLSVIDLIDNGLHTNVPAYKAAQTLLTLHGSLDSIRNVAQKNVDEAGNPYDARIGCGLIVQWMEEVLEKIEIVHDQHLNINHYKNK